MTLLDLLNIILIIALIIFSAWSFYLRFVSDRVTTIKDLLLAFVTGGALAVTTMVFGVTGEIMAISDEIKQDTSVIRTSLGQGEVADSARERPQDLRGIENNLNNIFRLLERNTQALQGLEASNRRLLGVLTSEKEIVSGAKLGVRLLETGFAVATVVEFQCLFSPASRTPVCSVVAPNSGAANVR